MSGERWEWLDRIEAIGPEGLTGRALFPPGSYASEDHFPGRRVVPGVLLLEAMAQATGWWAAWAEGFAGKGVLARVDDTVFRHPAVPGEPVRVCAEGLVVDGPRRAARCRIEGGSGVVASAWIGLRFFRFKEPDSPWCPPLNEAWMRARFERLRA